MKLRASKKSASSLKNIVKETFIELSGDSSVNFYEDSRILINLLEDRLYKYPNDLSRLKLAIEQGIHKGIYYDVTTNKTSEINKLINTLANIYGMTPETALSTVDILCFAIHGFSIENREESFGDYTGDKLLLGFSYSASSIVFFTVLYLLMPLKGLLCLWASVAAVLYFIIRDIRFYSKNKASKNFKNEIWGCTPEGKKTYARVYSHLMQILSWCVVISYCLLFGGSL